MTPKMKRVVPQDLLLNKAATAVLLSKVVMDNLKVATVDPPNRADMAVLPSKVAILDSNKADTVVLPSRVVMVNSKAVMDSLHPARASMENHPRAVQVDIQASSRVVMVLPHHQDIRWMWFGGFVTT